MQRVIGISLGNNTSASLISMNGVELAISEERLNGEKNTKQFPINALKECIIKMDPSLSETIYIGICSYEVINDRTLQYMPDSLIDRANYSDFYEFLTDFIKYECKLLFNEVIIQRVDHHDAHRLPAVYMSGFLNNDEKVIAITSDGFGDGISSTIFDQSTKEVLAKTNIDSSIALIYQFVTGALGYKEHQHEGKITGLAAFGKPIYLDKFRDKLIDYNPDENRFILNYKKQPFVPAAIDIKYNKNIHDFDSLLELKAHVYYLIDYLKRAKATDQDIAATVQVYTEELLCDWIQETILLNKINNYSIVLSGGLFANVKVNFKIKLVTASNSLYVLPFMGDEGTSVGAAIRVLINLVGESSINTESFGKDNLYLGAVKSDKQIDERIIDHDKYSVIHIGDDSLELQQIKLPSFIAEMLSKKNIVCVSRGNSEFGPRALANHSILYDAGEKEVNDSLNERLSRTEFMPFAPITIDKYTDDLFLYTHGLEKALKYMTIAVPVTKEFEDNYKAAYHVDKTARPQILSAEDNPIIYKAIELYTKLTNKKALINTSFNLHNHPIIYDDVTALNSFLSADLDVLILNDKIIAKRGALN